MSVTPDPHKPLRDDVRLLGELLGQAIRAREGDGTFAVVERVRALAKSGRAGDSTAFDTHAAELGGKGSKVYAALRANYTIEPAGTEHMKMMGAKMPTALGGLPTTPQGG
jgi:phosphoenolpyruvate carboxylase